MAGFFDFIGDLHDWQERNIDQHHDTESGLVVDTSIVSDGVQSFETAIKHPDYYDGKFIIVEAYDTIDEAQAGHDKWVGIMTTEPLPESLRDCGNSPQAKILQALGDPLVFRRKPTPGTSP